MSFPVKHSLKVVLFDHDDTLVGTIKAKWAQHKYIAKTFYGKTLKDEEIKQHWGVPFTVLLTKLYETDHIDMAMTYNIATRSLFPKFLFSDTIHTLQSLRKAGFKTGIVTATTSSSLNHDFSTLGISENLFDYLQTEDRTTFHKPDPRVFEPTKEWLAEMGIDSNEVLYVGDSMKDRDAAKAAGFHFVAVGTGLQNPEEFTGPPVKGIKSLSELLPLLIDR